MTVPHAARPPVFDVAIVTGFLGAGKTSLLNRLLRDPALADTLVLINEFGSIGIDHLLVEHVEGDMILMSSGCLCCSIRGDLVATLEDVLRKHDNGRMRAFARVVIETTGLADPVPVMQSMLAHPYLRLRFRLRTVVTLVDALLGGVTLDAHEEAVKQVAVADRLLLSKTDLVADATSLASLRRRLWAINPAALTGESCTADAASLFGESARDNTAFDAALALGHDARHHGSQGDFADAHHAHDVNRHDASIRAFSLRHRGCISADALSCFLTLLAATYGRHLLRFKGLIALADDPARPAVVHGVRHVVHEVERLGSWPDADRDTRMVFILQDLNFRTVEALWQAASGQPIVDGADLDARCANPLAHGGSGLLG